MSFEGFEELEWSEEHLELLARARALTDQGQRMSEDLAHMVSQFYITLIEDGLPEPTAAMLARDFLCELTASAE